MAPLPRVGSTVHYTLGHNRHQRRAGYGVVPATVVGHNADGTVALWVYAPCPPHHEYLRPWVPHHAGPPGTARAAGKWSWAPLA